MTTRTTQRDDELSLSAPRGTPLYVHLPFCEAKCHYCDFYSVPAEGQNVAGTLDAIEHEIRERAPEHPRTVFVGGGTPSLLGIDQLKRLFGTLERRSGFSASAREVTVECNPESLNAEKVRCLADLGVTRLSIGFQSLRAETLELFGRVHSVAQSFRAYEAARSVGHLQVNLDLIYAIPGQALSDWQADLERILALGPDHLSAYNLTFEEDTLFRRWLEQGRVRALNDEAELEFFQWTRARLRRAGLPAYEVSNFASNGLFCAHNVNYWHNGEYLGVGPSAVSKIRGRRFGNLKPLGEYRRRMAEGSSAEAWHEAPGPWARLGETWWLGLRLSEGLRADEAWTRAGIPDWSDAADPALEIARRMGDGGWLECTEGTWRLTDRGWPLADAVAREFLRLKDHVPSAAPKALPRGLS